MSKIKKFICLIASLVLMLISFMTPFVQAGIDIGSTVNVVTVMTSDQAIAAYGGYPIKHWKESAGKYTYVICDMCGYYDNGTFYPAYCLDKTLPRSRILFWRI